ncbi:hypothetical protein BKA65DRAFT_17236 [Rhexocercosporidium sp. MPI-PUGE-AT-0058]|nr:hypothetical protein BKA65DRAFT_17236 [Rhexocercosporidium sp. MPI-PUGE-AT-0058]
MQCSTHHATCRAPAFLLLLLLPLPSPSSIFSSPLVDRQTDRQKRQTEKTLEAMHTSITCMGSQPSSQPTNHQSVWVPTVPVHYGVGRRK